MPPPRTDRSILIVHPGAELYGSDRVMLDSATALVRRGWDVTVALPEHGPLEQPLLDAGVRLRLQRTAVLRKAALRPIGALALLWSALRSAPGCISLLRSSRPDVVYVSTLTIPMWLVLARLCRVPVVCHVHEAESAAPRLVRRAMAAPLLLADALIANSGFSLEVLTDVLGRLARRATVVPNPVPGPPARTPARAELHGGLRLLYLGRLSPRKGPHLVVEAVHLLAERGVHAHLELVGAVFTGYEWYEEQLRESIRTLGLQEQVTMRGFEPVVWPALAASDVVVVPSVMPEPFGNTAVEAVLAARPVVVAASGGLPEAVHGFGSAAVVPVDSAPSIADALQRIAREWPTAAHRAADDALIAAARHDPEHYGDRLDEIVGARARHPRRHEAHRG